MERHDPPLELAWSRLNADWLEPQPPLTAQVNLIGWHYDPVEEQVHDGHTLHDDHDNPVVHGAHDIESKSVGELLELGDVHHVDHVVARPAVPDDTLHGRGPGGGDGSTGQPSNSHESPVQRTGALVELQTLRHAHEATQTDPDRLSQAQQDFEEIRLVQEKAAATIEEQRLRLAEADDKLRDAAHTAEAHASTWQALSKALLTIRALEQQLSKSEAEARQLRSEQAEPQKSLQDATRDEHGGRSTEREAAPRGEHEKKIADLEAALRGEYEKKSADLEAALRGEHEKKLANLEADRGHLYQQLQRALGRVRVICRFRPRLSNEANDQLADVERISDQKVRLGQTTYNFYHVFDRASSDQDVWGVVMNLVQPVFTGLSCCIFTYGQTGTGKTYTMTHTFQQTMRIVFLEGPGVLEHGWKWTVSMQIVEVLNNKVLDLSSDERKPVSGNAATMRGCQDLHLRSLDDATEILAAALKRRTTKRTHQNKTSSRSHALVMLRISGRNELLNEDKSGMLCFADLAGGESYADAADDASRAEGNHIRQDNLFVHKLLTDMAEERRVIGNDRQLTRLLLPFFIDDSSLVGMIVTASPLQRNLARTQESFVVGKQSAGVSVGKVTRG